MFGAHFLHSSAACRSENYELHHLEQLKFQDNFLPGLGLG